MTMSSNSATAASAAGPSVLTVRVWSSRSTTAFMKAGNPAWAKRL